MYCLTLKIPFDLEMIWYELIVMHLSVDGIECPNFYRLCLYWKTFLSFYGVKHLGEMILYY